MAYFFWQGSTAGAGVARFDWNYPPNWKVSLNSVTNLSNLSTLPSATSAPGPLDYAYIGNVSTPTNPVGYGLTARSPLFYGGCSGTMPIGGSTAGGSPIWLNAARGTTGTTFTSSLQSIFIDLGHRKGPNGLTSCKYPFTDLGGGLIVNGYTYNWAIADGMSAGVLNASLTGTTGSRAADGLNLKVANTIDIITTGSITGAMPPSAADLSEADYSRVIINLIPSKSQSYFNNSNMASCVTHVKLRPDYFGSYGAGQVYLNRYKQYGTTNTGSVPLIQTLEIFGVGTAGTTFNSPLTWTNKNPKPQELFFFETSSDASIGQIGAVILNTKIYEIGNHYFGAGITFGEMQVGKPSFDGNVLPFERGEDTDPTYGYSNSLNLVGPIFNYANAASTLGFATTNYDKLLSKSGIKLYQLHALAPNSPSYLNYNYTPRIIINEDLRALIEGNRTIAKIPTLIGAFSSTRTNTNGQRATNLTTVPWRIEIGSSLSCTAATISNYSTLTSRDFGEFFDGAEVNINTLNLSTNATLDLTSPNSSGVNNWFFGTLTGNSIIGGINFNDATPVIKADPDISFFNTKLAVGNFDNRGSTNLPIVAELLEKDKGGGPFGQL